MIKSDKAARFLAHFEMCVCVQRRLVITSRTKKKKKMSGIAAWSHSKYHVFTQ